MMTGHSTEGDQLDSEVNRGIMDLRGTIIVCAGLRKLRQDSIKRKQLSQDDRMTECLNRLL